ncbi:MAG: cupin domain-containing protein [Alphaproteobacteria bacterium]|nr:cupin domain-containing protein [Alphaproteobacteria bacterium]
MALAVAQSLPLPEGRRSAEVFRDGDLEVRIAASPSRGPQIPHDRDELYIVAAGHGHYRVGDTLTAVGTGDLLFAAAHAPHGFEDCTDDFSVWVIFYGPLK